MAIPLRGSGVGAPSPKFLHAKLRHYPNAENGEIVVALIEDEATIKKIFTKKI